MKARAKAEFSQLSALIEATTAIGTPAQIEREARAAVPEVKRLYEEDFLLAESPEGDAWAPQKHPYGHPLLLDTRALWSSAEVDPLPDGVEASTGIPYAGFLHDGTPKMEPRRLLPVAFLGPRWDAGIAKARLSALGLPT